MSVAALALVAIGLLMVVAGFAGLAFPAMPGAPLLFLGLVCLAWAEDFAYVGMGTLGVMAVLALATYIVDFVAGAFGVQRFGASPQAMIGATAGAIVGIFFGLFGIVAGPFVGAAIGELIAGRDLRSASRAGVGATIGLVIGVAGKLALAFAMVGLYVVMRLV